MTHAQDLARWVHIQEDPIPFQGFQGKELEFRQLSRPLRPILKANTFAFLVQCGNPEQDQDPKSCYVIYYGESGGAVKIVWPTTLEEIRPALAYYGTDEQNLHFKTESIAKIPRDQIPSAYRDDDSDSGDEDFYVVIREYQDADGTWKTAESRYPKPERQNR